MSGLGPPAFGEPGWWWAAAVLIVGWLAVRWLQRRALAAVEAAVSGRFRRLLTRHGRRSLDVHLGVLLAAGLLLVAAAARPLLPRAGEDELAGGRVLLAIDASASMYASDVDGAASRLELARRLASELVAGLDGHSFALTSFSGSSTLHLPMTRQRQEVAAALAVLEHHTIYRGSGSSLGAALDRAFLFVDPQRDDLTVVLLGDGELAQPEQAELYAEPLGALAAQGVPVHTVAVGSLAGQARHILNFADVVAKVPEPRRLREFTTRRVDEHLRRIAAATGGSFRVAVDAEDGAMDPVVEAIRARRPRLRGAGGAAGDGAADRDLTIWPLGLALALFLTEALWLRRAGGRRGPAFDLERLGQGTTAAAAVDRGAALLLLALVLAGLTACGGDAPLELAHRDNEAGIALDLLGSHRQAQGRYARSRGYGEQVEVPTHNLGRSRVLGEDFAGAHESFQEALEMAPDLPEAHYNDGVALFRWGAAERDPRDCDLERTRELWSAAGERFAGARERAGDDAALKARARDNLAATGVALSRIERLIAEPPEHCRSESPPPPPPSPPPEPPPDPPSAEQGGGGGEPPPLSGDDQDQLAAARERIEQQRRREGRYHRRTRAEQFSRQSWLRPDRELWW